MIEDYLSLNEPLGDSNMTEFSTIVNSVDPQ